MTPQEIIQMLGQGQYPVIPGQQQEQQPVSDFGIGTLAPTSTQGQALTSALGNLSQSQSQPQTQQQTPSPDVSGQVMNQLGVKQQPQQMQSGGTGYTTHIVKPGDTLWGIAHQYTGNGDNWTKLGGFHQDPRTFQPGTAIQIPNSLQSKQQTPKKTTTVGKAPSNVFTGGGNLG